MRITKISCRVPTRTSYRPLIGTKKGRERNLSSRPAPNHTHTHSGWVVEQPNPHFFLVVCSTTRPVKSPPGPVRQRQREIAPLHSRLSARSGARSAPLRSGNEATVRLCAIHASISDFVPLGCYVRHKNHCPWVL